MSKLTQLERQFRQLHAQSTTEYDEALHRRQEEHARMTAARAAHRRDEFQRISRILEVPIATLEGKDPTAHALTATGKAARSSLIERPSMQAGNAKRFSQHPALLLPNRRIVPSYATNIMSATREEVAGIPGKRGNPWVLPWNPGQIEISQMATNDQYGLCGWAQVEIPPISADVWFAFLADTTANWNFLVFAKVHGFFLVNANNSFALCREAHTILEVSTQVYQYFWYPETKI